MARPGLPVASDTDTVALVDVRSIRPSAWADDSQSGETLTVSTGDGTGFPKTTRGPFGWAARFGDSSNTNTDAFVSLAPTAWTGSFTVECWMRYTDSTATAANPVSCVDGTGTGNADGLTYDDAWALSIANDSGTLYPRFTVWNDGNAASVAVQSSTPITGILTSGRWVNLRGVFTVSTDARIYVDGVLVGVETHALANVANTNIDVIRIGSSWQSGGGAGTAFDVANVHIRDVADTNGDTMSCRLGGRITRRQWVAVDIDLGERLEDETWTDSGTGSHWLGFGDIDLSGFIYDEQDVVSVSTDTSGVEATLSTQGNQSDCEASDDSQFVDVVNSRLYVRAGTNTDPGTLNLVRLRTRARVSDKGSHYGGRVWGGALVGAEGGQRRMGLFEQAIPTGDGATLSAATSWSGWPAGVFDEGASGAIWAGAPARLRVLSDSHLWGSAQKTLTGMVDAQPEGDDASTFTVVSQAQRLHRTPMRDLSINTDDYANSYKDHRGYVFPVGIGRNLLEVPCKIIDKSSAPYTYKIFDHPIARIQEVRRRDDGSPIRMIAVDLDLAEFTANTALADDIVADVDGFGDPSSPTTTNVYEHGDVDDIYDVPKDVIQQILQQFIGFAAADVTDSTWATTAARVGVWLRDIAERSSPGSGAQALATACLNSLAWIYPLRAGGWGWRDVNKSESSQWTLTDADVVKYESWVDTSRLAERATVDILDFRRNSSYEFEEFEEAAQLEILGQSKYDRLAAWRAPQRGWFYTREAAQAWLTAAYNIWAEPMRMARVVTSGRLQPAELMDVVTDSTSFLPTGAGARHRILDAAVRADGTVELLLFSETPFPADGTSTAGSRAAVPALPQLLTQCDLSGIAISTGGPTNVAQTYLVWMVNVNGMLKDFAAGTTHVFEVYAQRAGGAADSDLKFDLYDLENSNVIATIGGVGTSLDYYSTTTFANVPTDNARFIIRSTGASGATGTLYSWRWWATENTPSIETAYSGPAIAWHWGDSAGISLAATSDVWTTVPNIRISGAPGWNTQLGTILTPVYYLDVGAATGYQFRIRETRGHRDEWWDTSYPYVNTTIATGYNWLQPNLIRGHEYELQYRSTTGTMTFYGVAYIYYQVV